jgi:hypothetical protein
MCFIKTVGYFFWKKRVRQIDPLSLLYFFLLLRKSSVEVFLCWLAMVYFLLWLVLDTGGCMLRGLGHRGLFFYLLNTLYILIGFNKIHLSILILLENEGSENESIKVVDYC